MPMKHLWTPNRIIAILLLLFSLGYIYLAYQIPAFTLKTPVDSDLFPKVLGFTMLFLAILLFFHKDDKTEEMKNEKSSAEQEADLKLKLQRRKFMVVVLFTVVYVFLFEILGFILSTVLFIIVSTYYLGYRKHIRSIATAVLLTLALYLGLTKALSIHLPEGWLPFI